MVIDAAVELADREGYDNLTLTSLASMLGVRPPSLYNYVDGSDGLRHELIRRASCELGQVFRTAVDGHGGEDAIRSLAAAYREFSQCHPGLFAALLPGRQIAEDPELWALAGEALDPVRAALGDLGFVDEELQIAVRLVRSTLSGFISLELSDGFGVDLDVTTSYHALVDLLVTGLRDVSPR